MPKSPSSLPRFYLRHPELFGRPGEVEWLQPATPDQYAGLRAAEVQHAFALAVLSRLEELDQSARDLELIAALPAGRLRKLVRGHAQLTLRDIAVLEGVLGPILPRVEFSKTRLASAELRSRYLRD